MTRTAPTRAHTRAQARPRITVCIPSIPPRTALLQRALLSVEAQTYPAYEVIVAVDHDREGAAVTRNRALMQAKTGWVAFLDDDDEMYPQHLERLVAHQLETGADVVWPWFDVIGGGDPFPVHFGRQWDPEHPHSFPITTLVRRRRAVKVGGFPDEPWEDWNFWLRMNAAGAKFAHLPERTWAYHHDSYNTSGRPNRW